MNIYTKFVNNTSMEKISLIKNQELFQGEKYINSNKNYFEGWYFKNTNTNHAISFIPGISIDEYEKKAFIQIITDTTSYFVNFSIDDFKFCTYPFYIKIGDNFFSKNNIHININDNYQNLAVYGDIKYSNGKNINTNFLNPNIMGPFSYIPFMECNHAILNMNVTTDGLITINDKKIIFDNDTGYMEKDWGCSFPKSYIWCQGNDFENSSASFMLSIADIPFKLFNFRGIICDLLVDDSEYKFTTYNNTKLIKYDVNDNFLNIILQKGYYSLTITSKFSNRSRLFAPVKGKMSKDIFESISSLVTVTLQKGNHIIFSDTSKNCGLEIVD